MVDPISLAAAISLLINNASVWLPPIYDTFLRKGTEKGADFAIDRGLKIERDWLHIDEKEQLKHLKRVLRNAAERSVAKFEAQNDRDRLRDILTVLSEPGFHSEALRTEVMNSFTLSNSPNFETLSELYNHALRFRTLTQTTASKDIDATPYLSSFFVALRDEMYSDALFHGLISDALKVQGILNMECSLTEVVRTLHQIGGMLTADYTTEQFEQDLAVYVTYLERTLRHLKLVGVVPKDRGNENTDPELDAIFVPLHVSLQDRPRLINQTSNSIVALLEYFPRIVLLGDPGTGKSTVIRHLAWSHAMANLPTSSITLSNPSLLSGKHLPLRIELRRMVEDRKQLPDYDFLDYAKEILLERAGIHIHRQMFEELLERRPMLFLFDGLDEVATLDDRRRLVEEIENFAQSYPGNCILVTSRSVGYELAPLSKHWFSHAQIQEFNDQQIRLFLERWYTHVLRLSPLPPDDQQELETLYKTLTQNTRLHTLAANPLLLTVITALHRYERLPDRRILVYDRCADLLLDIWAKLRGTDVRWKDMKMGKEDQYACVAHLGFALHERSQESKEGILESTSIDLTSSVRDFANDVPTKFLLREIEHFLRSRKLISEVAEQRVEAERFLELMRVETGLIVERGKDESDEDLYGFVHRTFQEYFAAADVYERYLQEDNSTIISDFLANHLHDPHWSEVVLLLLGKLKRKQATVQLRRILEGKSRLSKYTEIVKQDLFFACTCLAEEINGCSGQFIRYLCKNTSCYFLLPK